ERFGPGVGEQEREITSETLGQFGLQGFIAVIRFVGRVVDRLRESELIEKGASWIEWPRSRYGLVERPPDSQVPSYVRDVGSGSRHVAGEQPLDRKIPRIDVGIAGIDRPIGRSNTIRQRQNPVRRNLRHGHRWRPLRERE